MKAEEKEKKRLEKEAYEKAKAEKLAKDALLQAQRDEALAKTEADMIKAQEKAAAAQKAYDDAEAQRKKSLEA